MPDVFNAMNKPIMCGDKLRLDLAKSLLYEVLHDTGKSEYKFLIYIINGILNMN